MQLVFSAEKFKKYASNRIQRRLADYLDLLDGQPVTNSLYAKCYVADGDYDLVFPAHLEWCDFAQDNKKAPARRQPQLGAKAK